MSARRSLAALTLVLAFAACESRITRENFEKVTDGMSYAQVRAILGSGEDQTATGTGITTYGLATGEARSNRKVYVWKDGHRTITVVFDNGKVVEKIAQGF